MNHSTIDRRRFLRGMLQGSAVGVGLPLLDMFLNENGNALASGEPLPACFGTWYWGLGLCYGHWAPEKTGTDYELRPQLQVLAPIKDKINIFSGMQAQLDGTTAQTHFSGQQCIMTGRVSDVKAGYGRSIDEVIAGKMTGRTRFRSLTVSCDGNPTITYSSRGKNAMNPPEISPLALYKRIFAGGFQDPNQDGFKPDPDIMLRKSALSLVTEERHKLLQQAGAEDKVRLDEFFTSLRALEQKLALELEKPAPAPACKLPGAPENETPNIEIENTLNNHHLFAGLISHALACGQTRVFNMTMSHNLVRAGDPTSAHTHTHEEHTDPVLGYQPTAFWFASRYLEGFLKVVQLLDGIREGDGTLLDRTLVMAYTDHGDSRVHHYRQMPLFTAGRAGGGMKTGYHIAAENDPCSRVALTCQQALKLPVESWGEGSNRVTTGFSEVLA